MTTPFTLWVPGLPAAQGSKAYKGHRPNKAGRLVPVLVEESKAVEPWRNLVTGEAQLQIMRRRSGRPWVPMDGPLHLAVTFYLARPKTVTRALPTVPPDLDKLLRALCDGLTDANVWADDSRVVQITAGKSYVLRGQDPDPLGPDKPGHRPGAHLTVTHADPTKATNR